MIHKQHSTVQWLVLFARERSSWQASCTGVHCLELQVSKDTELSFCWCRCNHHRVWYLAHSCLVSEVLWGNKEYTLYSGICWRPGMAVHAFARAYVWHQSGLNSLSRFCFQWLRLPDQAVNEAYSFIVLMSAALYFTNGGTALHDVSPATVDLW